MTFCMGRARTTLLVLVSLGACAATAVMAREAVTSPGGSARILESPKEVIDQTLQIVFRDYLDVNGKLLPVRPSLSLVSELRLETHPEATAVALAAPGLMRS
jgi:hypothetical protein